MKNLILTTLISVAIAGSAVAQPPLAAPKTGGNAPALQKNFDPFISIAGGFEIGLPSISGFKGIKPIEGKSKGGSTFEWRQPIGYFTVSFDDRVFSQGDKERLVSELAKDHIENSKQFGFELLHSKEIKLGNIIGTEVRTSTDVSVRNVRYFLSGSRLYTLTAAWTVDEKGDEQLKILNTFKLVNTEEIIAKKLIESTPKDLPQSPEIKRQSTDVFDLRLAGQVKSLHESREYLSGTGSVGGIINDSDMYFDQKGNLLKEINFDYQGNPSVVIVYGFIDGRRVSKSGDYISYEYNPPPALSASPAQGDKEFKKPTDDRFSREIYNKYDEKGRVVETLVKNNRDEVTSRIVYRYLDKKVERTSFNSKGDLTSRSEETLDDAGQPSSIIRFSTSTQYPADSTYAYSYLESDEFGNWTKREVRAKTARWREGTNDLHFVEYRRIEYFPGK